MTETILTAAQIQYAKAVADLAELRTYEAEAKARLKNAKTHVVQVEKVTKAYAPRVVSTVKALNKTSRGWTRFGLGGVAFGVNASSDEDFIALGVLADDKIKSTGVDHEQVLETLWRTAIEIQNGKKAVTAPRLLKRVGL